MVEGIGEDFVPPICRSVARRRRPTRSPTRRASPTARELLREGRHPRPARRPARCSPPRCATAASRPTPKRVVTFVCDSGNKYLSKVYNDYWMVDQGLLEREQHGDLRDLIVAPHRERRRRHRRPRRHACSPPISRMKLVDVSQLPVLDGGRLVGIVDESDLLRRVDGRGQAAGASASRSATAMTAAAATRCRPTQPLDALLPMFDRGQVAIVMDGDEFLGLDHPHRPAQPSAADARMSRR